MRKTKSLLIIILLLSFSVVIRTVSIAESNSETIKLIYLKDGQVIKCDMGWIDGDTLYYQKYGGTLGIPLIKE